MLKALSLKLLRLAAILLLVSLGAFFLLDLVPGDPAAAVLGEGATPEQFAEVRAELGLDRPAMERYADWMGGILTGDFGRSMQPPVQEVSDVIAARLPVTLEIALLAMVMAVGVAVPLALWSAQRVGRIDDGIIGLGTSAAVSVPSFLAALLLIYAVIFNTSMVIAVLSGIFGVVAGACLCRAAWGLSRERTVAAGLPWLLSAAAAGLGAALVLTGFPDFPRQGFVRIEDGGLSENLRSVFLPALTLAIVECAVFTRILRNDLINTLGEDFVLFARAKGMPTWWVLLRHALRPSSLSLVTVAGVAFGRLIGGTVIVEVIFRVPGMGSMLIESIQSKDYPIVQAGILLIAGVYVLMNALVDISYTVIDPRLRHGHS